jgi:predicted acylesterase/phospholipase RssA
MAAPPAYGHVVISGGGTRCVAFAAALERLGAHGALRGARHWWGVSAGALLAALMAVALPPQAAAAAAPSAAAAARVAALLVHADFTRFLDVDLRLLLQFGQAWGVDDGGALRAALAALLEAARRGASALRMRDVPHLHVVVTDATAEAAVVCDASTEPDLPLLTALRASMALPPILTPVRAPNGHVWTDGGVATDNFPWACLPDEAARADALGLVFAPTAAPPPAAAAAAAAKPPHHVADLAAAKPPHHVADFLSGIVFFGEAARRRALRAAYRRHLVWVVLPPFPAWYLPLTAADRAVLVRGGAAAADAWLRDARARDRFDAAPKAATAPGAPKPRPRTRGWSF